MKDGADAGAGDGVAVEGAPKLKLTGEGELLVGLLADPKLKVGVVDGAVESKLTGVGAFDDNC